MKSNLLRVLLREQRHIFGVCPNCDALFRFTDLRLGDGRKYTPDWLDRLEETKEANQEKLDDLGDREEKLRQEAIERAHKTELPRLLRRIAPLFSTREMSPQDVKTIFHPLDYIAFPGMNAGDVKSVTFLDHKSSNTVRKSVQDSIRKAVSTRAVSWGTIRIDVTGKISGE